MSFRNTILENVRNNQPSAPELPAIPKFHSEQSVDLKRKFAAALKELSGEVVTELRLILRNSSRTDSLTRR